MRRAPRSQYHHTHKQPTQCRLIYNPTRPCVCACVRVVVCFVCVCGVRCFIAWLGFLGPRSPLDAPPSSLGIGRGAAGNVRSHTPLIMDTQQQHTHTHSATTTHTHTLCMRRIIGCCYRQPDWYGRAVPGGHQLTIRQFVAGTGKTAHAHAHRTHRTHAHIAHFCITFQFFPHAHIYTQKQSK